LGRRRSTLRYLGIEIDDAIEIVEKIEIRCNWAARGGSAQRSTIETVESGATLRAQSDEHCLTPSPQDYNRNDVFDNSRDP